jgi:hypothetical protein
MKQQQMIDCNEQGDVNIDPAISCGSRGHETTNPGDCASSSGHSRYDGSSARNRMNRQGCSRLQDVVIPWGGIGGITLFARAGSKAHRWLLMMAPNEARQAAR